MKTKTIIVLIMLILCFVGLSACDEGAHLGEAKTPSGSAAMKGRDYQDVYQTFQKKGFTDIETVPIEDLILGWLTKDGEVEKVTVGGNEHYFADCWMPADTKVVITYHTFPTEAGNAANTGAEAKQRDWDSEWQALQAMPDLGYTVACLRTINSADNRYFYLFSPRRRVVTELWIQYQHHSSEIDRIQLETRQLEGSLETECAVLSAESGEIIMYYQYDKDDASVVVQYDDNHTAHSRYHVVDVTDIVARMQTILQEKGMSAEYIVRGLSAEE